MKYDVWAMSLVEAAEGKRKTQFRYTKSQFVSQEKLPMFTTKKVLTTFEHLSVWMVNGYLKAQSLEQNVLIVDEFLRLLLVLLENVFNNNTTSWEFSTQKRNENSGEAK